MRYTNSMIFCFISIVCFINSKSFAIPLLPENEYDALKAVENGSLDSSIYLLIKPYYSNPISVPDGELFILKDFFPDLFENISSDTLQSNKYKPWNPDNIQFFFNDFPQFLALKPVLSFAAHSKKYAKMELSSRGDLRKHTYLHSGQLFFEPCEKVHFNMRMEMTDSTFDVIYRTLNAVMGPFVKITVGNYSMTSDKGMFFGYFPPVDTIQEPDNLFNKWLYSSGSFWNGINGTITKLPINATNNLSGNIQLHKRLTEEIVTCNLGIDHKPVKINAGVYYLKIPQTGSVFYYGQVITTIQLGTFFFETQIGLDFKNLEIPITLESVFCRQRNTLAVKLIIIPDNFYSPESRLLKLYKQNDITCQGNLTVLNMRMNHQFTDWFNIGTHLEAVFSKNVSGSIQSSIECSGNAGQFYYMVEISKKQFLNCIDTNNLLIQSVLNFQIRDYLSLNTSIKITSILKNEYTCYMVSGLSVYPTKSFLLEPFIRLEIDKTGNLFFICGIKQTLSLFEKTNSSLKIEIPVNKKGKGGLYAQTTMSFLF